MAPFLSSNSETVLDSLFQRLPFFFEPLEDSLAAEMETVVIVAYCPIFENFSPEGEFFKIYSHLCYACSLILLSALRNAETRELFQHGELPTNSYKKNDIE